MTLYVVSNNLNPRKPLRVRINNKIFELSEDQEKDVRKCMLYERIEDIEEYAAMCLVKQTNWILNWQIAPIESSEEFKKKKN